MKKIIQYASKIAEKFYNKKAKIKRIKSENNYDGSYFPSISNNLLTPQRIWELRNYAFRSFYFRPLFLLKKIISIKTFYEFKNFIKYGISFLLKINPDLA